MKKKLLFAFIICTLILTACKSGNDGESSLVSENGGNVTFEDCGESATAEISEESTASDGNGEDEKASNSGESSTEEVKIEITKALKNRGDTNPIITQDFGADPFAMVYGDTVYIFMTADAFEYDGEGEIKENTYSQIRSIHLVSTQDMKNFTDHGLIEVAGPKGAAKWAHNSWAPSAAWKNIDGKDKFFLYFADNGGGIGVLEADSPLGPYRDPLGKALISRDIPNCGNVMWLFDPAVLVDDDNSAYLYFGGGVPEGKESNPGTGRVVKLTEDMIGIDGEVVTIDVPYLFEDSGIHKHSGKYYYSYCTNWNVDDEGKGKYGFASGQIAVLESDSPMGPFTYKERILDNPGSFCGLYGNNHHAVFTFADEWYIIYHSRFLEKKMGVEHGYRSTFINRFEYKEDGTIGLITQSKEGPSQLASVNPFEENLATKVSVMSGTKAEYIQGNPTGILTLTDINTGDYIEVDGVDFDINKANSICVKARPIEGESLSLDSNTCKVHVRVNFPNSKDIAVINLSEENLNAEGFYEADLLEEVSGVNYLFLVFEGEGYMIDSWHIK